MVGVVALGRSGSVSDNNPGRRDVYIFQCMADDSKSVLYRSKQGIDMGIGDFREVISTGAEVVKELRKGESYEMSLKTDKSTEPMRIRFTHE